MVQTPLFHPRQADFSVGPYTFEVGEARKNKRQIHDKNLSFLVREEWDTSADPQIIPLWAFGLGASAVHTD